MATERYGTKFSLQAKTITTSFKGRSRPVDDVDSIVLDKGELWYSSALCSGILRCLIKI